MVSTYHHYFSTWMPTRVERDCVCEICGLAHVDTMWIDDCDNVTSRVCLLCILEAFGLKYTRVWNEVSINQRTMREEDGEDQS